MKTVRAIVVLSLGYANAATVTAHSPSAAAIMMAAPPRYSAVGSGHLLKRITDEGRFLTLEDGSRWDVAAADRFQTVEWQVDAAMTVTAAQGEAGFDYQLLNTTDDESVSAKFIPKD